MLAQTVTWPVHAILGFLIVQTIELLSNSCEIADFGRLRAVSKNWRICLQLTPLEVELRYIEHKSANYFASFAEPVINSNMRCPTGRHHSAFCKLLFLPPTARGSFQMLEAGWPRSLQCKHHTAPRAFHTSKHSLACSSRSLTGFTHCFLCLHQKVICIRTSHVSSAVLVV